MERAPPFLWLPVCAGAGAIVHILAATEPRLWRVAVARRRLRASAPPSPATGAPVMLPLAALAAFFAGELFAGWRVARLDAPVLRQDVYRR